jgi:hypothetical protein
MKMSVLTALLAGFVGASLLSHGAFAQTAGGMWPQPRECSNISPSVQRSCIERRIETKERTLNQLYPNAVAAARSQFAKWGRNDNRLDPRHFIQAHADWGRFVASNCIAIGAIGGGSNSSISDRVAECRERALDERIALYRAIADGSYGL